MKKITNYILICTCALGFSSCVNTFLDLEPLDAKTDVIYFKTPEHFREYANGLYGQLLGWQSSYGSIFDHMDAASDLSTCFRYSYGVGTGVMGVPNDDSRWENCYGNIRATNHMFERAVSSYTGNLADIKKELAEGHFFRAYNYFYLLKFFGGVPVVTKVLDVTSPELYGKRNSRYEVVNLILSDLDEAIAGLPLEQNITSADKGKISRQAAQAFKARVLLYEATWRKYNGTSTDFEGSAGPASDQVNAFLEESVQLSETVMGDAAYSLWNYNNVAAMKNLSSRYLFNIEEEASNPAGAGRATNKEFIIASVYSQETRKGQVALNQVIYTLYNRMICGAGDYTNCFFAERVTEKMGGRAAQLAKRIAIYSPWQFIFWYDRPYNAPSRAGGAGSAESVIKADAITDFYCSIPVVWDDTRFYEGDMDSYAVVARRSASDWYLSVLNAGDKRQVVLPLGMLKDQSRYKATLYYQAPGKKKAVVSVKEIKLQGQENLTLDVEGNSGCVLYLTPCKK